MKLEALLNSAAAMSETAGGSSLFTSGATSDEDSDSRSAISYQERRREAHTFAEQKRRDSIKRGYDLLQELVPSCHPASASGGVCSDGAAADDQLTVHSAGGAVKLSKAAVLHKSIEYTEYLLQQRRRHNEELDNLRKEMLALQILKTNYEQLVVAHQNRPSRTDTQVSDELKFQVFRCIMEQLFESFATCVNVENFAALSGSMIAWMEEHVTPHELRNVCQSVLRQLANESDQ